MIEKKYIEKNPNNHCEITHRLIPHIAYHTDDGFGEYK